MNLTTSNLLHELHEQQQASMQRMLEAWDKELDAQAEAFREAAKKQAAQEAVQGQNAAALGVYLEGLIAQAKGGSDISVSIPSGMRIASHLAFAPAAAELESLADAANDSEAEFAHAQASAAFALSHALMPHPGDLEALMRGAKVDAPFADRLNAIATQLDRLDRAPTQHPQMAAMAAQDRLLSLKDQVGVMKAYGAQRTIELVKNPLKLGASLNRAVPGPPQSRGPKMGHAALGKVLDGLFKR